MLTPPHLPEPLTVEDLADFTAASDHDETTLVHRGYGRHVVNDPDNRCWCSPLELTHDDIHGPTAHRTARRLAEFFAVH